MGEPHPCPGPDALQRLLAGNCPEPEAQSLEAHLAFCSDCLKTLRALCINDGLVEAARAGNRVAEILGERVDEALLARLYRLKPSGIGASGATPGDTPPGTACQAPSDLPTREALDFLAPSEGPGEIGRLAGYRVIRLLGAGGMGVVLEAEDPRLQRRVALKAMRPTLAATAWARQRFLREAQALAAMRHDHVVPIYEVGEDRGIPFLAMPLLAGQNLEQRLQLQGQLPIADLLRIGREAAEGLAATHARGLIHRDVKPANIWLESKDEGPNKDRDPPPRDRPPYRVQLLDFGLARAGAGQGNLTGCGVPVGTPVYMAPEQSLGEAVDWRSDLFSLGVILYRMATGRLPFEGRNRTPGLPALAQGQPVSPCEINHNVPRGLADLILQLLSRDPAMRPASAGEVADRLKALEQRGAPPAGTRAQPPALAGTLPGSRPARSRWGLAAAALAALLPLAYVYGGVMVRFATNRGLVVIEVNDPETEVTVTEGGALIQDRKGQRQVTLVAGKHELEVTVRDPTGEVRFFTTCFQLRRGGTEVVSVRQELARQTAGTFSRRDGEPPDAPAPAAPAEAEHRAALWALSRGAEGTILVGDGNKDLAFARNLQAGTYKVAKVILGPESKASDAELAHLAELPNLISLKLQGAWVNDASLAHVRALQNLRRLDLVATRVSDAGLVHLLGLANLNHLILVNTAISDAGLVRLKSLPKLQHLGLHATRVTQAGTDQLAAFPNLTGWLTLGDGVTDEWLGHLQALTRLTGLGLASNPVTDAGLASLKAWPNLQWLDLSHTRVTDAGLTHLTKFKNLQQLRLDGTQVSDGGLVHLKGLRNLTSLSLGNTRLTDAGLVQLVGLAPPGEWSLSLRGTRLSARAVAGFKEAFPQAAIEWSEPNRTAAEAVLALGGTVRLRCQDQSHDRLVRVAADLPQEYFRLTRASLAGVRKPPGDALAKVAVLTDPQFDCFESLDLSGSTVTDADLACLDRLTGLRRLALDATDIRVAALVHLKNLAHLTQLRLGCRGITDLGAGVVGELKGLERLSLAGSGLTDTGLAALKELSALRELDLTGTDVSPRGIAEIQEALPHCTIISEHTRGR
jgi:Leucine-rich repeat (LRR) protein/tRNA A-37 threonylcarbamoyl transferase component Bud32